MPLTLMLFHSHIAVLLEDMYHMLMAWSDSIKDEDYLKAKYILGIGKPNYYLSISWNNVIP